MDKLQTTYLKRPFTALATCLMTLAIPAVAGEPTYPVGCPGLDAVELTVIPFAGLQLPDPPPDEPIHLSEGEIFTIAVDVGPLGNNRSTFLLVTLDDNLVNGDTGELIGFALVSEPGHVEFPAIAPEGQVGTYYAVATLISDEMLELECNNVAQEYNVLAPLVFGGCLGDANGDGWVDPLDVGYVLSRFNCDVGTGDPQCDSADVNDDGAIDPLDAGYVLARLGTCS